MHNKKNKQRYLDYVYSIAVKRALERMVEEKVIISEEVNGLFFSLDEHTTATNGLYELKELLSGIFKDGKHDDDWDMFCPPLFPNVHTLTVNYCNSKKKTLVRAADIVANHIYHRAVSQDRLAFESDKITIIKQP